MPEPVVRTPAEIISERLAVYLGPNTARTALKTFSDRALGVAPDAVTRQQAPHLLEALRPMLKTLLGAAQSDAILKDLSKELTA